MVRTREHGDTEVVIEIVPVADQPVTISEASVQFLGSEEEWNQYVHEDASREGSMNFEYVPQCFDSSGSQSHFLIEKQVLGAPKETAHQWSTRIHRGSGSQANTTSAIV